MARTLSTNQSGRFKEIYAAVLDALEEGLKQILAGVQARDCDAAIRKTLNSHGLEEFFIHSSGHGVGLEVHEGPKISKNSKDVFREGMVVSIEPGVYIPNWGGIRIEEMVLVGKKPKVLTSLSTDWR
jgi:Xaa-Pro aminopeptidase